MHPALNNDNQASLGPRARWRQTCLRAGLIWIAITLGACTTGELGRWQSSEDRAVDLAEQGRYEAAASMYIELAGSQVGLERDRLTLLAIQQWLDAGDIARARGAFRAVEEPAGGEPLWLWQMNLAALQLVDGRPDDALAAVGSISAANLPQRIRLRADALSADAWFQKGQPLRALEQLRQRETWLSNSTSILYNRQRTWQGLMVSDEETLRNAREQATDREISGWLSLALMAQTTRQSGSAWSQGLADWQRQFPGHPAISIVGGTVDIPAPRFERPSRVALLLPLSGPARPAGVAVRDGFLGAYYADQAGFASGQSVRVYDVNDLGPTRAYEQAVAGGAQFVIGPLLRDDVAQLAREPVLPVPVMALNYLPGDSGGPPGFFQFALAPEDEASSAAERAIVDGFTRGVALVPNNDWGRRLLNSFATEFENRGGLLLEYRSYLPETQDYSIEIEGLMHLSDSVQRYRRLRANLGEPLQFESRRRQDVEFIFLAADAGVARLIKPQLRFHYSGDLPVYSTSSVYAMDGRSDTDLNGLMFADAPWVIAPAGSFATLPDFYLSSWPEARRQSRLHAMGFDAYQLAPLLYDRSIGDIPELDGATGRLYLDATGRVHRRLAWARFSRGKPLPLPSFEELRLPAEDEDDEGLVEAWQVETPGD